MDWALVSEVPSWGAAADRGPTMLSFARPSSFPAAETQLHDLSLGLVQRARPPGSSGAGRRPRGVGSGGVSDACSVDGCRADLSQCRQYHRRHKVCEAHSKTPVVVVRGQEQRFCQQCSRFHMLSEFDEGKRSCRKRLDGHNRRRRKPQQDMMNLRGFFPYSQVNQFAIHPQPATRSGQNSQSMHLVDRQQAFSISFSGTFTEPKQLPFSQDAGSMLNAIDPNSLRAEHDSHTGSRSLSSTLGHECALSLLCHHRCVILPQHMVQHRSVPHAFASLPQDATTASAVGDASGVAHHTFVLDALFEDPSQALPFIWQ